jgi:phosphonate transport system substrate-binding protein
MWPQYLRGGLIGEESVPMDAGIRRTYRASAFSRRHLLAGAAAALIVPRDASAERPITFGLTPVFLDSDVQLLARLEEYLRRFFNRPVQLVKRRTY